MAQQPPPGRPLRLEIPANLAATYANAAMVTQTHSEFVLDFMQLLPNDPRARVLTRVVMTPANTRMLMDALATQIGRFEEAHGKIDLPAQAATLADQLFGPAKRDDEEGPDHG